MIKSKTEVFKVASPQIFCATDFGLLSTAEIVQMRYALKSSDYRQNLGSLDDYFFRNRDDQNDFIQNNWLPGTRLNNWQCVYIDIGALMLNMTYMVNCNEPLCLNRKFGNIT